MYFHAQRDQLESPCHVLKMQTQPRVADHSSMHMNSLYSTKNHVKSGLEQLFIHIRSIEAFGDYLTSRKVKKIEQESIAQLKGAHCCHQDAASSESCYQ